MDKVEFELQDFCINSGIIGFINMLKKADDSKAHIEETQSTLIVDKEWLLNLDIASLYFEALISKYQDICPLTNIIKRLESLQDGEYQKDKIKKIIDNLSSNRYKAGYNLIEKELDFNFYDNLTKLKISTEDNYKENIETILDNLNNAKLKEIFLIKDIIYFVIKYFWNNVSFLNRSASTNDPKEEFRKSFEEPFKQFMGREPKGDEYCAECGIAIKGGKVKPSFVNSLTEDFARKNSNYWNFKPNCYVCPKCNLMFASMPLGFVSFGNNFVFVNENSSIDILKSVNSERLVNEDEVNSISGYYKYNLIVKDLSEASLRQLNNIEIITNLSDLEKYNFDIVSKSVLLRLKQNEKTLEGLAKRYVIRLKEGNLNVYDEVMYCIVNNLSLYPLIHKLLLISISDANNENAFTYCNSILKIERGGKRIMYDVIDAGAKYRNILLARQNEKRVKDLTFQLLDLLQAEDTRGILNLVINISTIVDEPMPVEFMKARHDKEKLLDVAYDFAMGFRSGKKEEE